MVIGIGFVVGCTGVVRGCTGVLALGCTGGGDVVCAGTCPLEVCTGGCLVCEVDEVALVEVLGDIVLDFIDVVVGETVVGFIGLVECGTVVEFVDLVVDFVGETLVEFVGLVVDLVGRTVEDGETKHAPL